MLHQSDALPARDSVLRLQGIEPSGRVEVVVLIVALAIDPERKVLCGVGHSSVMLSLLDRLWQRFEVRLEKGGPRARFCGEVELEVLWLVSLFLHIMADIGARR
jgi:hypothetical protein